jgi:hypothetical protein
MKRLIGLALVAATALAHGQGNNAIPGAPTSAAKKDLVQRLLTIQQPALENMTRELMERPARQMMGAAEEALETRVAPEKRQDAVKKIQDLLNKYRDETTPLVRERTTRIAQSTLGPVFEEKYSEDELKQLVTMLESPVYKKFQQSLPELTNTYAQGAVKDLQPVVEPKLKALEQGVAAALGVNAAGAAAPKAAPKAAAPAASKPPAKK